VKEASNVTLLFVDDEPDHLNSLRRYLRKEPYQALFAGSGEEALGILAARPIDIIVSDLRMPGMDGLTLLKRVQTDYPEITRLIFSAHHDIDQTAALHTGFVHQFLAKPQTPKPFRRFLKDAINHHLLISENGAALPNPIKCSLDASPQQHRGDPEVTTAGIPSGPHEGIYPNATDLLPPNGSDPAGSAFAEDLIEPLREDIHILFVDDEELTLKALARFLRNEPFCLHFAGSGAKALDIMAQTLIHILVTDMAMPQMDGLELLRQVKDKHPDSLRLVLSAHTTAHQLLPCINTGQIFRYITKPVDPAEFRGTIREAISYHRMRSDRILLVNELKLKNEKLRQATLMQQHIANQLRRLAVTDELTGLFNRRHLTESLNHEFEQCRRYGTDLSCLMLDLDHFKSVNDTYGHAFGDLVLWEFSSRLKETMRSSDLGFRYGGEELTVLLPHIPLEKALVFGERILQSCRTTPFQYQDRSIIVTVSIGIACFKHHRPQTPEEMLQIADRLLYEAKQGGRDRIKS